MELKDFQHWMRVERTLSGVTGLIKTQESEERLNRLQRVDRHLFESISKRAWLNLLLQILKVTEIKYIFLFIY